MGLNLVNGYGCIKDVKTMFSRETFERATAVVVKLCCICFKP